MPVTLKPAGMLKDYIAGQTEVTLPAGKDVRAMLESIHIPPELAALVLVNNIARQKDYIPLDGDVVQVYAVIGGG